MWTFFVLEPGVFRQRLEAGMRSADSHVFFHPTLVRVWMDTYSPIRKLSSIPIEARSTSGNSALLPLVLWRRNWRQGFVNSIVPVGYSDYDYHDPLFSHSPSVEELKAFWSELSEFLRQFGADEIRLDGIRSDMVGDSEAWRRDEICPNMDISAFKDGEQLLGSFSTKLRGDIRRQIRRLNEIGELHLVEYASGSEVPEEVWKTFMEFHSRKWPNAYKAPGFHRRLMECCSLDGPVHFSTLMAGDRHVAWHLGFEHNGVYYYYMPCGNPEFSKQSPVKVHLYYLMARAIAKGLTQFDHLRGDETYKEGWSDGSTFVNSLLIENPSVTYNAKKLIIYFKSLIIK